MAQKKISVANKELFVLRTPLISESTEKTIQVHDFLKKIEDQETNQQKIVSARFQIAGMEFSIDVYPDAAVYDGSGFIGVYLHNYSKETLMSSVTVKEASGKENSWEMRKEPETERGFGWNKFLSQEKYREWAKDHGDVLKLEVLVTLHTKTEGDGWTR